MKTKFTRDISASSLQVMINQSCGLLIFYIISTYLDKRSFGELNWTLAVLLTAFNILSFGIDQVAIKRIASGNDAGQIFTMYATHVILAGSVFYGILLAGQVIFTSFFQHHQLLLLLGIGKLLFFFSTPFKQLAIGLEKFRPLAIMSVCSNVARCVALLVTAVFHQPGLTLVVFIFIAGDIAELVLCYFMAKYSLKIPMRIGWNKAGYRQIIRESLPNVGVVVFSSAIARFDWILLGLLASNILLAEYSFAYKVFEMATLPLLVIAPILVPRFTKIFRDQPAHNRTGKLNDMLVLLQMEMIIASLTAMVLTICWVPVIDWITLGKYGAVNRYTILILAAGMPFLYLNNFLWTINFARGALQMIFRIILCSFLVNITANIILIPYLGGEGAALAYLFTILVQCALFLQKTAIEGLSKIGYSFLPIPVYALLSSLPAMLLFQQWWLVLAASVFFFGILLFLTRKTIHYNWLVFKRVTGV